MKYDTAAAEREESGAHEKGKRCVPASSPLYLSASALFALLSLCGLFTGFFFQSPLGTLLAGGETIWGGSLFGILIEIARGSLPFPVPVWNAGLGGVLPAVLYGMCVLLAFSALLIPALAAIAFVRPERARAVCFFCGGLLFSVYGGLLLGESLLGAKPFDVSVACLIPASALLLGILAAVRGGGEGAIGFCLLLCSAAPAGAFCVAGAPLSTALSALFTGFGVGEALLAAFFGVICFNLLFSLFTLGRRRIAAAELTRFSVQAVLSLALAVYFSAEGFFTVRPLSAALLLLPSLAGIFLSTVSRVLFPAKRA